MTQGVGGAPSLPARGRVSRIGPAPPPQARPASARHAPPTQLRPSRGPEAAPHQTMVLSNTILPPSSLPGRLSRRLNNTPSDWPALSTNHTPPSPRCLLGVVGAARIKGRAGRADRNNAQKEGPASTLPVIRVLPWSSPLAGSERSCGETSERAVVVSAPAPLFSKSGRLTFSRPLCSR